MTAKGLAILKCCWYRHVLYALYHGYILYALYNMCICYSVLFCSMATWVIFILRYWTMLSEQCCVHAAHEFMNRIAHISGNSICPHEWQRRDLRYQNVEHTHIIRIVYCLICLLPSIVRIACQRCFVLYHGYIDNIHLEI